MSDTNRVQVGIVEETTFNTTPASPAIAELRITEAPDLSLGPVTVTSNELRSDRQVTDLILVNKEPGGSIGHELSYEALDLLFEGALFNDWEELPVRDNGTKTGLIVSVAASDDHFGVLSGASNFLSQYLVYTTGFATSGNNGLFRVLSQTSKDITVDGSLTNEDPVANTDARIKVVGIECSAADLSTTATPNPNTLTSAGGIDWTDYEIEPGDWIRIGGSADGDKFATAAVNDWVRVDIDGTITATVIPLDIVPSGWAADNGAGKTVQIFLGDRLTNGTTEKSYTLEEQFTDHSPVRYIYYTGQEIDNLTLNLEAASIATANTTFVGAGGSTTETRVTSASDVAAPTEDVLNTSSNVGFIGEGGEVITSNYVMSATIEINNNLRRQIAVGTLGAIGIGAGECTITGRLNTYFEDGTMFAKIMDNTETSFNCILDDDNENSIVIDLPRVKYTEGAPAVPGKNQDVMVDLGYQALRQADVDYQIKIQRFDYVINSNS